MTLNDWLKNDWLKKHSPSADEVANLLGKIGRDLTEAAKTGIDLDWRLAIAYNACLGCATVALRAAGYRAPEGDGHHYRTIESLRHTMKPSPELITALQAIRKKRAIVSYDAAGIVTEADVEEAVKIAGELHAQLLPWLKASYSTLLQP